MQSPKHKKRNTISSPAKTDRKGGLDETLQTLETTNQDLQFQIGEKDIENERMKTTLFALNEKLAVMEDIEKDIEEHKKYLKTSETSRVDLQNHITETSSQITKYTEEHNVQIS